MHLCIVKYLTQEPGYLAYLLAWVSSKYMLIFTHFGAYFHSIHVVACLWYQGFAGGFITHYGCHSNNIVALCLGLRKLTHWISGEMDWLPSTVSPCTSAPMAPPCLELVSLFTRPYGYMYSPQKGSLIPVSLWICIFYHNPLCSLLFLVTW